MGDRAPRRYWLTGAGNGIGAALAEAILQGGAHLAISTRHAQVCEAFSARFPGQVLALPGDLSDSQTVRSMGEQILQHWGSLDTVILNAGTGEFVEDHPHPDTAMELLVRSNLLATSLCIQTASPLLCSGTTPHLVGLASAVTYLSPSVTEAGGSAMAELFVQARVDLMPWGVDVTLVHPGFNSPTGEPDDCFTRPGHWSADDAAADVLRHLNERPREVRLAAASMTALWPLHTPTEAVPADCNPHQARNRSPIKGQP